MRICEKEADGLQAKPVRKQWLEDLVVNEVMKAVMDGKAIEAIVSMVMDLQDRENTGLPLCEQQPREVETGIQNLLNAIYLYDDKLVLTFNYKDGIRTIPLDDVKEAAEENPYHLSIRVYILWIRNFDAISFFFPFSR